MDDDAIKQYREEMGQWEQSMGMPAIKIDETAVDAAINMSVDNVKALSPEDAFAHAFVLAQFALQLQRRLNQCNAFVTWAKVNRGRIARSETVEHRVRQALVHVERLSFLSRRVEFLSDVLMRIHRMRRTES